MATILSNLERYFSIRKQRLPGTEEESFNQLFTLCVLLPIKCEVRASACTRLSCEYAQAKEYDLYFQRHGYELNLHNKTQSFHKYFSPNTELLSKNYFFSN